MSNYYKRGQIKRNGQLLFRVSLVLKIFIVIITYFIFKSVNDDPFIGHSDSYTYNSKKIDFLKLINQIINNNAETFDYKVLNDFFSKDIYLNSLKNTFESSFDNEDYN